MLDNKPPDHSSFHLGLSRIWLYSSYHQLIFPTSSQHDAPTTKVQGGDGALRMMTCIWFLINAALDTKEPCWLSDIPFGKLQIVNGFALTTLPLSSALWTVQALVKQIALSSFYHLSFHHLSYRLKFLVASLTNRLRTQSFGDYFTVITPEIMFRSLHNQAPLA